MGRRRSKKKRLPNCTLLSNCSVEPAVEQTNDVDVEYVYQPVLDEDNQLYQEFADIFAKFQPQIIEEEGEEAEMNQEVSDEMDEEQVEQANVISKKKLKKMNRINIAQLKQLVKRPEIVDWEDTTAKDPKFLVFLKSIRNSVPVPMHWSQKRRYLAGKRGFVKPPFELPPFIVDTGIMDLRDSLKEDHTRFKTKMRNKMHPKLGKLSVDYEKLYNAFFKYQTKPRLTLHGDLYHEGKEFETTLKLKRPGILSEELRLALAMPSNAPPPWLINMQRYGPPPSYPNLRIPGLNAPIPEGAQWGYQPGGWGKPPVDENNRPLYGDVFATGGYKPVQFAQVDRTIWGELEEMSEFHLDLDEEEGEEPPQHEEEQEEEEEEEVKEEKVEMISTLEIPENLQLRKEKSDEHRELYSVLQQKATPISGLMGTQFQYEITKEVSLDPQEAEELTEQVLKAKMMPAKAIRIEKEDLSDMVADHASKMEKKMEKKRKAAESNKKSKEFKF